MTESFQANQNFSRIAEALEGILKEFRLLNKTLLEGPSTESEMTPYGPIYDLTDGMNLPHETS